VRATKPKLYGLLSQGERAVVSGERLLVRFARAQRFAREEVQQADCRELLAGLASDLAGRTLVVETMIDEEQVPPASEPLPENAAGVERLRERALQEPLVQAFIHTLKGELDDVRPEEGDESIIEGSGTTRG
jgi:hypothetical protein